MEGGQRKKNPNTLNNPLFFSPESYIHLSENVISKLLSSHCLLRCLAVLSSECNSRGREGGCLEREPCPLGCYLDKLFCLNSSCQSALLVSSFHANLVLIMLDYHSLHLILSLITWRKQEGATVFSPLATESPPRVLAAMEIACP